MTQCTVVKVTLREELLTHLSYNSNCEFLQIMVLIFRYMEAIIFTVIWVKVFKRVRRVNHECHSLNVRLWLSSTLEAVG